MQNRAIKYYIMADPYRKFIVGVRALGQTEGTTIGTCPIVPTKRKTFIWWWGEGGGGQGVSESASQRGEHEMTFGPFREKDIITLTMLQLAVHKSL